MVPMTGTERTVPIRKSNSCVEIVSFVGETIFFYLWLFCLHYLLDVACNVYFIFVFRLVYVVPDEVLRCGDEILKL